MTHWLVPSVLCDMFDLTMELKTIDDFGGWQEVQEKHFADGGIFDQIYGN